MIIKKIIIIDNFYKNRMKEYKGKFYKKITSKPHYLFGAHFDYY